MKNTINDWKLPSQISTDVCVELKQLLSNIIPKTITFGHVNLSELENVTFGYIKCRGNEPKKRKQYGPDRFDKFYTDMKKHFNLTIALNYCFGLYYNNILIGITLFGDGILLGTKPFSSYQLFGNLMIQTNNKFDQFKYDFPELYNGVCLKNTSKKHYGFNKFDILTMTDGYMD
eukprot:49581_1